MNFQEFQNSLSNRTPPVELPNYLKALWLDAKNNWGDAHSIIQGTEDKTAAWIHAYLHRKEGDIGNADYWYSRAGKKRPATSLEQEWENIVRELL